MSVSGWRRAAQEAIWKALKESDGKTEKEIKKALEDAYPFGEREHYPYKVWREEIKRCRKQFVLLKKAQQLSLMEDHHEGT